LKTRAGIGWVGAPQFLMPWRQVLWLPAWKFKLEYFIHAQAQLKQIPNYEYDIKNSVMLCCPSHPLSSLIYLSISQSMYQYIQYYGLEIGEKHSVMLYFSLLEGQ
jgi:hypothetical protein